MCLQCKLVYSLVRARPVSSLSESHARSHAAALVAEGGYRLHQYLAHVHVVFWVCSSDARVGMSRGQCTTSRCVCLCCHVVSEPHLGQVGHVGGKLGHRKGLREGQLWDNKRGGFWEVAWEHVAPL